MESPGIRARERTASGPRPLRGVLLEHALALLLAGAAAPAAASDPYSAEAIAAKDYRGVGLNVLSVEKPVLGEPVELYAREFEALTGAKLNVTFVPFNKLYQEVLQTIGTLIGGHTCRPGCTRHHGTQRERNAHTVASDAPRRGRACRRAGYAMLAEAVKQDTLVIPGICGLCGI